MICKTDIFLMRGGTETKEQKFDLYDQEQCIGTYTAKELAEMLHLSLSTLRVYISCGRKIKKRYYIERSVTKTQLREWDKITKQLREGGGK